VAALTLIALLILGALATAGIHYPSCGLGFLGNAFTKAGSYTLLSLSLFLLIGVVVARNYRKVDPSKSPFTDIDKYEQYRTVPQQNQQQEPTYGSLE